MHSDANSDTIPPLLTNVPEMRRRLIEFVKSKGGQADRTEMKEHLGIDPDIYWPCFNQATKTKKLIPIYERVEISPGMFLGRPIIGAYKLASKE